MITKDQITELANEAFMLGYKLRSEELGDLIPVPEVNTCIMIAATKGLRGYETNSFMRTKCVENILTNLPDVLYNAFNNKYDIDYLLNVLKNEKFRKKLRRAKTPKEFLNYIDEAEKYFETFIENIKKTF